MIDISKNPVCVEPSQSAVSVTLPAFAAEGRRLQHGAHSCRSISLAAGCSVATHQPPLLLSIDGTDRQMDGRTDGCLIVTWTLLHILCEQRQ